MPASDSYAYTSFTFAPASASGIALAQRLAAREYVSEGAVTASRRIGSLAASSPEQERALAKQNYGSGVTYEADSTDLAPASASKSSSAQRRAAPFRYEFISEKACKSHIAQSGTTIGWTKNHYAWCRIEYVTLQKWSLKNGVPTTLVAQLTMRRMVRGEGSRGHRTAKFHVLSYDIVTIKQWANGVYMDTALECAGWPTWNQCEIDGGQYTKVKTGSTQRANIKISSAVSGSSGKDDIGTAVFMTWSNAYEEARIAGAAGATQGMRCDSAHYLPKKRGCVFDRVEGTLTYDRKDSDVKAVAKHIYMAQQDPQDTYPKWTGKSVPSKLHRMYYDDKKRRANHRAAVKVCKAEWGKDYAASKKNDCDEYPFQSTKEGAAKGDKKFSARVLNKEQNETAGTRLGTWYDYDHILDGDAFHIAIK